MWEGKFYLFDLMFVEWVNFVVNGVIDGLMVILSYIGNVFGCF